MSALNSSFFVLRESFKPRWLSSDRKHHFMTIDYQRVSGNGSFALMWKSYWLFSKWLKCWSELSCSQCEEATINPDERRLVYSNCFLYEESIGEQVSYSAAVKPHNVQFPVVGCWWRIFTEDARPWNQSLKETLKLTACDYTLHLITHFATHWNSVEPTHCTADYYTLHQTQQSHQREDDIRTWWCFPDLGFLAIWWAWNQAHRHLGEDGKSKTIYQNLRVFFGWVAKSDFFLWTK